MKKTVFLVIFIVIIFSINVSAEYSEETNTIMAYTGDLFEFAKDSVNGETDFGGIFSYIKEAFLKEFKNISINFPTLFLLSLLFSLKNTVRLNSEISGILDFSFSACVILLTVNMMSDMFDMAYELCVSLSGFIMTTIPCLCGVIASSGYPVSATKSSFIILGASNILSFLITNIFFPALYISYIFSISSYIVKNNIFDAIKKSVLWILKISVPFIVGIFTTVLTVFMKSSSKIDEFVLKSAKLTIGNLVPFLGNVLSDSAQVIVSSVGQIKSQLGIAGVFGILSVLLIPIIKILCTILTFKILGIINCFMTDEKTFKYYDELSEISAVASGLSGTMAIVVLIGILVLMG